MADTAARLVDHVLPRAPVRQFVLSFPYEIRYRLAWDGELIAAVLRVFQRVVGGWYRRQARALGHSDGRCGSVTYVQRFGSSLNVNPPSSRPRFVHSRMRRWAVVSIICWTSSSISFPKQENLVACLNHAVNRICRYAMVGEKDHCHQAAVSKSANSRA
jgi:hypothetical protein